MSRRLPRDVQVHCPTCPWVSPSTTAGLAERALSLHSCDRHRNGPARNHRNTEETIMKRGPYKTITAPATASGSDWRHRAACLDEDPELFFPHPGDDIGAADAKAVCSSCPVRDACLDWALETGQDVGVWGGMSEDERRAFKRRQARVQARRTA